MNKKRFLGEYPSIYELVLKYPSGGLEGDWAIVNSIETFWNESRRRWLSDISTNSDKKLTDIDGNVIVRDDLHVCGTLYAYNINPSEKGLFESSEELIAAYPEGRQGDWALVGHTAPFSVWKWKKVGGTYQWADTGDTVNVEIPVNKYLEKDDFAKFIQENTEKQNSQDAQIANNKEHIDKYGPTEISITDLDEIERFKYFKERRAFVVVDREYNVGYMLVISDNMAHVLTQILFTHYTLNKDGKLDFTAHNHDKLFVYSRNYGLTMGERKWSAWEDYKKGLQEKLVSGQNISTINGHSLLEGGDIIIEGGGGGGGGIKIVQSLGNDPNSVMSQKAVTDNHNELQKQIDELVAGKAVLSLTASPSVIHKGVSTTVEVTAKITDVTADMTISKKNSSGENDIAQQSKVETLTASDAVTETTEYTVEAIYKSKILYAFKTVTAVYPIYVGSGTSYTDVAVDVHKQTPRISPSGSYSFNAEEGDYIFIIIPATMNMRLDAVILTDSGFGVPFENALSQRINGISYKVYQSSNTYKQGLIKITVK